MSKKTTEELKDGLIKALGSKLKTLPFEKSTIIFKDVSVEINAKEILRSISGMASAGETLAIMGPSGAGKSTLLNALAGRIQATSGSIRLNGEPVTRRMRRSISYVPQQDVFYPELTLRETLTFTTLLRLPDAMPYQLKLRRMHLIIDALELNKCLDTKIGSIIETGLSGGEKKRTSIACELLTNPKLLLLDEPTSGLDSAKAHGLVRMLTEHAMHAERTILAAIHQPSHQIFGMFSKVLILCEGEMAYFGPGKKIVEFFSRLGLHCNPLHNPADFILEQLKSDPETLKRVTKEARSARSREDWPKQLRGDDVEGEKQFNPERLTKDDSIVTVTVDESDIDARRLNHEDVKRNPNHEISIDEEDTNSYIDEDAKFQTGYLTQYKVLTKRAVIRSKGRFLSPFNFCYAIVMVFAGLEWFQLRREEESVLDRFGILHFLLVEQSMFTSLEALFRIFDFEGVFHRERSSGVYRLSAYYMAIMTSELPLIFLHCTLHAMIIYWMTGLMPAPANFGAFWFIFTLTTFVAQSFGFFSGVLIVNKDFKIAINLTFMIGFYLLAGFYNAHPASWFMWVRYASFLTFGMSALGKVEYMYGDPFKCYPPNITAFPEYCTNGTTFPGVAFLNKRNLNFGPLYLDVLVLVAIFAALRIVTYLLLRFVRRPKIC